MLIFGVLLNVEHVILLQLYELVVLSVLPSLKRPSASPRILLWWVEPMVIHSISTWELHYFVEVYFRSSGSSLLFFLSDLRIAANPLVFHAICANSNSTFVLKLHWDSFLLLLWLRHTLSTITVHDSSDWGSVRWTDQGTVSWSEHGSVMGTALCSLLCLVRLLGLHPTKWALGSWVASSSTLGTWNELLSASWLDITSCW